MSGISVPKAIFHLQFLPETEDETNPENHVNPV
jgi:hypothetical protein